MKKIFLRNVALVLLLTLLMPALAFGQAEKQQAILDEDLLFFQEILSYVLENYPFETNKADLIDSALKGMLQSLDPYSDFYNKDEAESIFSSLLGSFSGIGVHIELLEEYVKIVKPIKGQPGEKAGLEKNDLIIAVDNIDIKTMNLDEVARRIKGPQGSIVKLKIKRDGKLLDFAIKRETILVNPVNYEILEKNIGYIHLNEFNGQATMEIKKALKEFDNRKIERLILDLRDNPGGLLGQAISISRLFIPKGPIVHIREKNKALITHTSSLEKPKYKLVVLVNENTASASEILAGAVKDRKVGTIIGSQTYGKGLVQSIIPIDDGSMIKMTISEYLTPNKISINGIGVTPDIEIENTEEDFQLLEAIKILK